MVAQNMALYILYVLCVCMGRGNNGSENSVVPGEVPRHGPRDRTGSVRMPHPGNKCSQLFPG